MSESLPSGLTFDLVKADEVEDAHRLEMQEFPEDEAATLEQFKTRQELAPSLFLGAFLPPSSLNSKRVIIGYICATRSVLSTLTGESMKRHDPDGSSVCVHAVVVASQYQRRGVALALLKEYIARLSKDGLIKRILLICHESMRPLYEKAGFEYVGLSPVIHGASSWHEMRVTLEGSRDGKPASANAQSSSNATTSNPAPVSLPPGLLKALQKSSSSRNRPSARLLSSFSGGVDDIVADPGEVRTNKYDILCPRPTCGCTILKSGVGSLVQKELPELESVEQAPSGLLAPLAPSGSTAPCWLIQPNPMAFENIGFSRAVDRGPGQTLKLLSCADCDLGPLGWCVIGVPEFWLLSGRVGYRA